MDIHPLSPSDVPALLDLTLEVFGQFYEGSFRPVVGETVFTNRHGHWAEDYRRHLAGVHDPGNGKFGAVARIDGQVVGFIGWILERSTRHGEIDILVVEAACRRFGVGRALVEHAVAHLNTAGADVVSVGTGGDEFHAPARALYESLGFTPFPTVSYTKEI